MSRENTHQLLAFVLDRIQRRVGTLVRVVRQFIPEKGVVEQMHAVFLFVVEDAHFAGAGVGSLPCPLIIVPGGLSDDALVHGGRFAAVEAGLFRWVSERIL